MIIIYAHPNKTGHCGYILQKLKEKLDQDKKTYQILDLYQMNYDPVLKAEEHYTSGNNNIALETKEIQNLISKENNLVFIYPTWWNGTPSILKGFFDRVLVKGYAFEYKNKIPFGKLKNKTAKVITTSGGPTIYNKIIGFNSSLRNVTKNTLAFCGIKAKGYSIGSATRLTDKQKQKIDKLINKIF